MSRSFFIPTGIPSLRHLYLSCTHPLSIEKPQAEREFQEPNKKKKQKATLNKTVLVVINIGTNHKVKIEMDSRDIGTKSWIIKTEEKERIVWIRVVYICCFTLKKGGDAKRVQQTDLCVYVHIVWPWDDSACMYHKNTWWYISSSTTVYLKTKVRASVWMCLWLWVRLARDWREVIIFDLSCFFYFMLPKVEGSENKIGHVLVRERYDKNVSVQCLIYNL